MRNVNLENLVDVVFNRFDIQVFVYILLRSGLILELAH